MNWDEHELQLDYPCRWAYRLIGADPERMRAAVAEVVGERDHTLEHANTSNAGRYHALHLELVVHDEAQRVGIFKALARHGAIKIVL